MTNPRKLAALGALLLLGGCGTEEETVSECVSGGQEVAAGDVSGTWCDTIAVAGDVRVPAGAVLEVEAGTAVTLAEGARITVEGTLHLLGTADAPVTVDAAGASWGGIQVDGGVLEGTYAEITGRLAQLRVSGGELSLADSLLDLENPELSPDCTSITGGDIALEHVWITGCHCPLHVNAADSFVTTGSILDGAAVPVMIANATASLTGNHLVGGVPVMDIGGGIAADVSGNYWGGGPPDIDTDDLSQFTGTEDWSAEPLAGVGPR